MVPSRPDTSWQPLYPIGAGSAYLLYGMLLPIWFGWVGWKLLRIGAQEVLAVPHEPLSAADASTILIENRPSTSG